MIAIDRYPDKPTRSHKACLPMFKEEAHRTLIKLDGWNCRAWVDENLKAGFVSSRGTPLPVSKEVREAVERLAHEGRIPPLTVISGEWMKRRPEYEGPECIYLFRPLWLAGEWVGHMPFRAGWEWVNGLGVTVDDLSIIKSDQMPNEKLFIPASTTTGFKAFYERTVNVWRTEGVVVYKAEGIVYGDRSEMKKSKEMFKIKWREGHSGRTQCE